jgi:formylglycine-generating enzyme required for sulfatase activity
LDAIAWHSGNSNNKTHTVGLKLPNELGIYDMCGNVWEWCSDWYGGDYSTTAVTDPIIRPNLDDRRIQRGGSFKSDYEGWRIARHHGYSPEQGNNDNGFRIVFDAEI